MTDQHPLTDEIIADIAHGGYIDDYCQYHYVENDLRAAADWQLEQVLKAWEQCIQGPWYSRQVIYRFDQKLKAMRPTTTQEDN